MEKVLSDGDQAVPCQPRKAPIVWMLWAMRLPHLLEIPTDEFVYALALIVLSGVKRELNREAVNPVPSAISGWI